MSNVLTIDQGNSSTKVCVFDDDVMIASLRFAALSIEELFAIVEQYNVSNAIYCSVARMDIRMIESLRNSLNGNLIVLTHETPLPIKINYSTPHTLGFDRIAAVVGAATRYAESAYLVVDAGTAITLDMFAENRFLGGNISPGISLRFKSLNSYTEKLPIVEHIGSELVDFGTDTKTAILSGVVNGVVSEILVTFQKVKNMYHSAKLILTGGDAEYIKSCMPQMESEILVDENLVAYGLKRIFNYNENI